MSETRYVVVNIGCIECGVSSALVGVFGGKAEADAVAERLKDSHGWREGGQNTFEVFALTPMGEIAAEYLAVPR